MPCCQVMLSGSLNGLNTINNIPKRDERYGNPEVSEIPEDQVVYQSQLVLDRRPVKCFLTAEKFYWTINYLSPTSPRTQKKVTHSILLKDLITTNYEQSCDKNSKTNEIELFPSRFFSIHFSRKAKANKLKYHHLIFECPDSDVCQCWYDHFHERLEGFFRPKCLLVFINPIGGKKEAEKIYRTKVAPLFDVAKINVTKIVTERMNHAKDYLQAEDISSFDGVVAVGGDGMFSEVMNGMLRYKDGEHRTLKSADKKNIAIGIIPAGSTDTIVYCTTGGNDPTTAALQIILGDELPMDVCSVWHDNTFLKYSVSLMAYGYFGDIIRESEDLRWIGPKRYDFAGIKRFMVNKSYEGEITFLGKKESDNSDGSEEPLERCMQGCKRCSDFNNEQQSDYDNEDQWQTISGRFISVFGANISCRCAKSSTGISPHAHIGDGHIYLVLVRKTTRVRHLHHLIKVSEKTTGNFDFNFIEVYRVREFRFNPITKMTSSETALRHVVDDDRASSSNNSNIPHTRPQKLSDVSVWNVDGELVEQPSLQFKVHRQLIRLFARGIEDL